MSIFCKAVESASIRNGADITRRLQIDERVAAEWQELRHTAALADDLRQSETRLAAILEQLPVAVGAVDPDGRITLANALWRVYIPRQLPSYDPESAKRWRAFTADGESIAPSDWPAVQALRGQSVFGMDFLHRRDDGRDVWLRISAAPFRDSAGNLIGAICVIEDIDARKRAEAALRDLTTTLEQRVADRTADLEQAMVEQQRLERETQRAGHFALLGRLAAGVSHELRNPLAAVFLHVDLLAEELAQPSVDSPALLAEYLAEVKTELARVDDTNWVWAGADVLEPDFSLALVELSRGGADATVVREFDMAMTWHQLPIRYGVWCFLFTSKSLSVMTPLSRL